MIWASKYSHNISTDSLESEYHNLEWNILRVCSTCAWKEYWLRRLSASNSVVLPLNGAITVTCVHFNTCYKAAVWLSPELEDNLQNLHVLEECAALLTWFCMHYCSTPITSWNGKRVGGTEPGVTETGITFSVRMNFSYAFRWWNAAILESVAIVLHCPAHILLSGFDR